MHLLGFTFLLVLIYLCGSARAAALGSKTVDAVDNAGDSSADVKRILASRQFKYARPGQRRRRDAVPFTGSGFGSPDSCPAAPLPTLGCKSCTLCTSASGSYCASASDSSDPQACGTCIEDRSPCPVTGTGTIATCTAGNCGIACDSQQGFTGPVTDCQPSSSYRFLAIPSTLYNLPGYSIYTHYIQTSGNAQKYMFATYLKWDPATNAYVGPIVQCQYNAGTGVLTFEYSDSNYFSGKQNSFTSVAVPKYCPAKATSRTSGSSCYNYAACQPSFSFGGTTYTLNYVNNDIGLPVTPTTPRQLLLDCNWYGGGTYANCQYDQITGLLSRQTVRVGGYDRPDLGAVCPPMRKEYASYCLSET